MTTTLGKIVTGSITKYDTSSSSRLIPNSLLKGKKNNASLKKEVPGTIGSKDNTTLFKVIACVCLLGIVSTLILVVRGNSSSGMVKIKSEIGMSKATYPGPTNMNPLTPTLIKTSQSVLIIQPPTPQIKQFERTEDLMTPQKKTSIKNKKFMEERKNLFDTSGQPLSRDVARPVPLLVYTSPSQKILNYSLKYDNTPRPFLEKTEERVTTPVTRDKQDCDSPVVDSDEVEEYLEESPLGTQFPKTSRGFYLIEKIKSL